MRSRKFLSSRLNVSVSLCLRKVVRSERLANNIIWWFEGDCWGLLRLSGTEPLVRTFAEAENRENAQKIIDVLKNSVKSCVGKV